MYANRIQLTNYGPIDTLDIVCPFDADTPQPLVLVGENGSGKSILLSHIVNGLLIAQQATYPETSETTAGRVYKLRSPSYIKSGCEFSFARVTFEDNIRTEELQLAKRRQDFAEPPSGILGTDAERLWTSMDPAETSVFSSHFDGQRIQERFGQNCILYLPPNRFEEPAWLNEENLHAKARHMTRKRLKGHTERRVINASPLRDNENWLFDVVYDFSVFELQTTHVTLPLERPGKSKVTVPLPIFAGFSGRAKALYDICLRVLQSIIQGSNVRFGIGTRNDRVISVMENDRRRVPNVFQLSSGEVSLLNMFLSILRDFDLCQTAIAQPEDVRGVVVVDEVDLHLHAVHQHDVLPKLMQMFPRVQFIITTHSPLFVLGLRSALRDTGFGLYRLPQGQRIAAEEFSEFGDAYRVFRKTNTHRAALEESVRRAETPLVLVDGTTDIQYLLRAMALRGWNDTLNAIEIRDGGGDGNLKNAWKTLTATSLLRQTVVLLHDCDSAATSRDSESVFQRKVAAIEGHPIQKGIENLFSREILEKAMAHKRAFVDVVAEHQATERGLQTTVPEKWRINKDEKTNLCNWLCENGTAEDFQCFDRILDLLRQIPGLARASAADPVQGESSP